MGKKSRAKKTRREIKAQFENLVQVRQPSQEEVKRFLEGLPQDGWIETGDGFEHESGLCGMHGFPDKKAEH